MTADAEAFVPGNLIAVSVIPISPVDESELALSVGVAKLRCGLLSGAAG